MCCFRCFPNGILCDDCSERKLSFFQLTKSGINITDEGGEEIEREREREREREARIGEKLERERERVIRIWE